MNLISHNHQEREFRSTLMTNGPLVMLWQLYYWPIISILVIFYAMTAFLWQFCYGSYAMTAMLWHLCYGSYAMATLLKMSTWNRQGRQQDKHYGPISLKLKRWYVILSSTKKLTSQLRHAKSHVLIDWPKKKLET
jgi:hypothetical protein